MESVYNINNIWATNLIFYKDVCIWFACPSDLTCPSRMVYGSVSQTVVRGRQVVLGFCLCGPFRLNISPKKTEKIKLTW